MTDHERCYVTVSDTMNEADGRRCALPLDHDGPHVPSPDGATTLVPLTSAELLLASDALGVASTETGDDEEWAERVDRLNEHRFRPALTADPELPATAHYVDALAVPDPSSGWARMGLALSLYAGAPAYLAVDVPPKYRATLAELAAPDRRALHGAAGEVRALWAMTAEEVADVLDALEAADVAACAWCEEATDGELARQGSGEHDDECPMAGTGRFAERAGVLRRLAGLPIDYEDARAALDVDDA